MDLDRIISIDAETNGLAGRAFAVALTLSDHTGELDHAVYRCPIGEVITDPWVEEHVLDAIADVPVNLANYSQLLAEIERTITSWGGNQVPLIAHVAWPVEARLLLDVYSGQRVWAGPYPLIDVASVLLAKGHNPTSVDDYLQAHGIPTPDGSRHNPLYDARAAERCLRHLMTTDPVIGYCADLQPGRPTGQAYRCTQPVDHPGEHQAAIDGHTVATWPRTSPA